MTEHFATLRCSSRKFKHLSGAPRRVVIVDDFLDAADAEAAFLRICGGYDVQCCGDSAAACHLAASRNADIGLVDINMPGMDGFDVARAFRRCAQTRETVLIACTARDWMTIAVEARASGFDGYFGKGSDPNGLLSLLAQFE